MEHRIAYKVYYEDTDSLGVVYYANYLKFLERGRTELVGARGRDVQEWNRDGFYFVVYAMTIKFRKPAELGNIIDVVSDYSLTSPYRAVFKQRIERAGELLVDADVELVCLGPNRSVREFPDLAQMG